MFSFFKKKMREPEAPQHVAVNKDFVPFQQTKVEDDVASFEVPDFSEDDMNFDLGLGEFLSEKTQGLPMPKGLPVDAPPAPTVPPANPPQIQPAQNSEVSKMQPPLTAPQETTSMPVFEEEKIPEKKEEAAPAQSQTQISWAAEPAEEEAPDEDLPKFSVSAPISLSDTKPAEPAQPKVQGKSLKTVKQTAPIKLEAEKVQTAKEGLFLPKQHYTKMIILAEDTSKKSESADKIKSEFVSLSDNKDLTIEALIKNMKSIRDSVMLADSKLFGR
ncbi:MAG: hypothetical protein ACP5N3_00045 [Candidatus Nanoarchaeia archaeon]